MPEADIFADFEAKPAPRLAAFDGLERMIYIGSFSKTLSAAARSGFIATKPNWITPLIDLKLATSFGGGALAAELVLELLKNGTYRRHIATLHGRLAKARAMVGAKLEAIGLVPRLTPSAGMFLWCQLPQGLDAADVARHALQKGLVLAPGNAFSPSLSAKRYMRFNVAQSLSPAMVPLLGQAMQAPTKQKKGRAKLGPSPTGRYETRERTRLLRLVI